MSTAIRDARPSSYLAPERNLASCLREAALRIPDKLALIFEDRRLSYSSFDAEAQRLAHKLIASGVRAGDCVALHMHNCPDLAIGYFACFYAGAIAVPVNTRMKAQEIE